MTPSADESPLPVPNPDVVFQPMPEGAVLLSTSDEVYLGLNQAGARIWELLTLAGSLAELCTELSERYPDVPAARLRADAQELLAQLEKARLVLPRHAHPDR